MKKKTPTPPISRFKEYKYDISMEQAVARSEKHPKPIGMQSKVKQWVQKEL